jgi:hypothetical protein
MGGCSEPRHAVRGTRAPLGLRRFELIAQAAESLGTQRFARLRKHFGFLFADVMVDRLLELTDEVGKVRSVFGVLDPADELPRFTVFFFAFVGELGTVGDLGTDDGIEDLLFGVGVGVGRRRP